MDVLEPSKHLIYKELHVIVGQSLRADNVVQVGAHQVSDEVNLLEGLQGVPMVERVKQSDDVLVVHVLQKAQLAERSLGMGGSLKGTIKFLDGYLCVGYSVDCRTAKINNRMKSSSARVVSFHDMKSSRSFACVTHCHTYQTRP